MRNTTRGIDHIGLTVADIAAAGRFLVDGLGAQFIYETLNERQPPFRGPETERAIGIPAGAEVCVIRMYRMEHGPGIELFYSAGCEQRPAVRCCDHGWQHVALYVDDLAAAIERAVKAGAELLAPPWDLTGVEGGAGNRFCMIRAPFGSVIELITCPSPPPYEDTTELRRWKPPATKPESNEEEAS